MAVDVITTACHPLKQVCLLFNVVGTHLMRKQFMSPELVPPLITDTTNIRFVDARDDIKHIDADPVVAYSPGDVSIQRTNMGALSGSGITEVATNVLFRVSTASKALTQELAFEIAALCAAMSKDLAAEQCYVIKSVATAGKKDTNSTFFVADTTVTLSLGYPIWKTQHLDSILREVRLSVDTH